MKQHLDREISEDYGGRTSGSLSWRLQRKETDLNSKDQILNEDITPSKDELQKMHFRLEYSSSNDQFSLLFVHLFFDLQTSSDIIDL